MNDGLLPHIKIKNRKKVTSPTWPHYINVNKIKDKNGIYKEKVFCEKILISPMIIFPR